MFPISYDIIAGTLVDYLSHSDVINLSSTNKDLRTWLLPKLFRSYRIPADPGHSFWKHCLRTDIPQFPPPSHLFSTGVIKAITSQMPLPSAVLALPGIVAVHVMHFGAGYTDLLLRRDDLPAAQRFFGSLQHLKISPPSFNISVDPATWKFIPLDSLVSITIPLLLGEHGTPEYAYWSTLSASLSTSNNNSLRTLVIGGMTYLTNDILDKYTVSPILLKLISSELLPALETFRFPFLQVTNGPGPIEDLDRRSLLSQFIAAAAEHAIINGRTNSWRLGATESRHRDFLCVTCTLDNCLCREATPNLTSVEYDDLLTIANNLQADIRVPEFFLPHLTVTFTTLLLAQASLSHPATMTALTRLELTFPPPLSGSTLFRSIKDLTLSFQSDEFAAISSYQPHITALPETFPRLSGLSLLLPEGYRISDFEVDEEVVFPGLLLPKMHLRTLSVYAHLISTKLPCGHGKLDFGEIQADWLRIECQVTCQECWKPVMTVGTRGIELHGTLGVPDFGDTAGPLAVVVERMRSGEREVRVASDFASWS